LVPETDLLFEGPKALSRSIFFNRFMSILLLRKIAGTGPHDNSKVGRSPLRRSLIDRKDAPRGLLNEGNLDGKRSLDGGVLRMSNHLIYKAIVSDCF
jgi:hypothetical protein